MTIEDLNDGVCVGITLEGITWDPYNLPYSLMEKAMMDIDGDILAPKYVDKNLVAHDEDTTTMMSSLNVILADNLWHNDLSNYAPGEACAIYTFVETAPLVNQQQEVPDWWYAS